MLDVKVLLVFLLTKFLERIPFVGYLHRRLSSMIFKNGCLLEIGAISYSRGGFRLKNMKLKNHFKRFELQIEDACFKLALMPTFTNRSLIFRYVSVKQVKVSYGDPVKPDIDHKKVNKPLSAAQFEARLKSSYPLLTKLFQHVDSLEAFSIEAAYKSHRFNCKNLNLASSRRFREKKHYLDVSGMLTDVTLKSSLINDTFTTIKTLKVSSKFKYNTAGFFMDKFSQITYNNIKICFGFGHSFTSQSKLEASLFLDKTSWTKISDSLPNFLTDNIYKIKIDGDIGLHFYLRVYFHNVHKHRFIINAVNNLSVQNNKHLQYLKYPFHHKRGDNSDKLNQYEFQERSKCHISLEHIPNHLINAVLTTEDPNFQRHRGIDVVGLGYALITNMLAGRFERGGSTITMQVARNIFLSHNKNISRKLEEIIITWLLESVMEIAKERILEIYFNIIEFSHNIYGIVDASRFYFAKEPKYLTLTESLVMTYVIPRPRFFLEALKDKSLILKANLKNHIKTYSTVMYEKGLITAFERDSVQYVIVFSKKIGQIDLS